MKNKVDPFQLEIIKSAFDAIADNMAITIMRTAHSGIVRDSLDFSTAICDAQGNTMAQGLCVPMQLGSFPDFMALLVREHAETTHPEDVFIANDPFAAAGQHLPDIYIAMPVFFEEALVGWSVTLAHHSDVGGIVAGSNALGVFEIFQEGLRLPIIKLVEAGINNKGVWDIILLNVRTADKVFGDLQAQIAGCIIGQREMIELVLRYGAETVAYYLDFLSDYTERLARTEVREIPDGSYAFTDYIDGLGDGPAIKLQVNVIIDGDRAIVDWEGSSPQVRGGINPSFPFTKACAYTAFRSVMKGDIPHTDGFNRVIEIRAPLGSIMNPVFPAPCGGRGITGYRMVDCLMGALSQAVPDRVTADGNGGSTLPSIGGYRDGTAFVFVETVVGAWGATTGHDGQEGVPHLGANQSNVPIEMIEAEYPLRIEEYGMVNDTGGPGFNRGGLSLVRSYRMLCDDAVLNVRSDKEKFPPHGLFGGREGHPASNMLNPGTESERRLPICMMVSERVAEGDLYRHIMAGGGGVGDPLEREPERVLFDVIEERVSAARAYEDYGVVVKEASPLPVLDMEATEGRRLEMHAAREEAE
jgi:N-methylhydantoinase B